MTQVDRALKGFESTAEWADLIAALTKLNRVISNNSDIIETNVEILIVGTARTHEVSNHTKEDTDK